MMLARFGLSLRDLGCAQGPLPQAAPSAIRNVPFVNPSFGKPDQQSTQEENITFGTKALYGRSADLVNTWGSAAVWVS